MSFIVGQNNCWGNFSTPKIAATRLQWVWAISQLLMLCHAEKWRHSPSVSKSWEDRKKNSSPRSNRPAKLKLWMMSHWLWKQESGASSQQRHLTESSMHGTKLGPSLMRKNENFPNWIWKENHKWMVCWGKFLILGWIDLVFFNQWNIFEAHPTQHPVMLLCDGHRSLDVISRAATEGVIIILCTPIHKAQPLDVSPLSLH